MALALAGCLLAATVSAARAAHASVPVLYVGGSTCSDGGSGTQTLPYCTIGAAAAAVAAGQTVQVAAGTYPEDVRPARSGTATAPIAFTAVPPGGAVVSGGTHAFDLSSRSYVTVTGFVSSGTTSSGLYLRSSDHITLQQDIVTTAGLPAAGYTAYGIYLSATTNSLVRGNVTYGNSAAGIYLTAGSTGNTIDGNESYGNANGYQRAANGIDVRSPGNVITHNRTHGNEDSGIQFYPGGDHNVVAGNVSYDNKGFTTTIESNCDRPVSGAAGCITGDHGIDDYATYGNVLTGNTVYGNVSAGINVEGDAATSTTATVGASDTTLLVSGANGFPDEWLVHRAGRQGADERRRRPGHDDLDGRPRRQRDDPGGPRRRLRRNRLLAQEPQRPGLLRRRTGQQRQRRQRHQLPGRPRRRSRHPATAPRARSGSTSTRGWAPPPTAT